MTRCFNSAFGHFSAVGRHLNGRGQEWRRNKHNTTCIGIGIEYGYSSSGVRPLDGEVLLVALRWKILEWELGKGMDDIQLGSCVFAWSSFCYLVADDLVSFCFCLFFPFFNVFENQK